MEGESAEARAWAAAAAEAYPLCPKPRLALGALLLGAGRTRAALRHYEHALELARHDDNDVWEAQCNGALAVVRLLQWRGRSPTSLSTATAWLRRAMAAKPDDAALQRSVGVLRRVPFGILEAPRESYALLAHAFSVNASTCQRLRDDFRNLADVGTRRSKHLQLRHAEVPGPLHVAHAP